MARIWIHWLDSDNHVALEFADGRVVLRRVQGGVVEDSASAAFHVVRNRLYQATIAYAGTGYALSVDGLNLLSLEAPGVSEGGTFGLGSKGVVTSFDFVHVE